LWWRVKEKTCESTAIVGVAKNAGKTTVLSAFMEQWSLCGPLGVCSIGIDGEERDAWSGRPKPQLKVPGGVWVATTDAIIDQKPGHFAVWEGTGITTTLGEVWIAQTTRPTQVKLAGVHTREEAHRVIEGLQRAGVRRIVVDGAYDRRMAASPWVTDSVILVVGASLGTSMSALVSKTAEWLRLFSLPVCPESDREALTPLLVHRGVYRKREGTWQSCAASTLMEQEALTTEILEAEAVALSGALTDRMLRHMMQRGCHPRLIVSDWTRIFTDPVLLRRYFERGGRIETVRSAVLRGVAVNPVSPEGHVFPPQELKARVAELCKPVPVFDVWRDPLEEGGDRDPLG
jgi:hypothetical protein